MNNRRFYSSRDVDMLTACLILIGRAIDIKEELALKRPAWADPYFPKLKEEIELAYNEQLGVDSNVEMRSKTIEAEKERKNSVDLLRLLKAELEIAYRPDTTRRDELLKQFGLFGNQFTRKQQDVLEQLHRAKLSLSKELIAEMTAKGVDPVLLAKIAKQADVARLTFSEQKNTKGLRKDITANSISELNKIFCDVMDICRLIQILYSADNQTKQKFCFTTVLSQIKKTAKKPTTEGSNESSAQSPDNSEKTTLQKGA